MMPGAAPGLQVRPAPRRPMRRNTPLRFPDAVHRLHLGAGTNVLDGWLNTDLEPTSADIQFLDSTKQFPFEDRSVDVVFSEHHLEHITYSEGGYMLRECRRVLKPGGRIRIATPDLGVLLRMYSAPQEPANARYISFITDRFVPEADRYNPVFVINNAFHSWGHQFLYDQATLRDLLTRTGFVDLVFGTPGQSADPRLRGVEGHGHFIGSEEINQFETMVVEATSR